MTTLKEPFSEPGEIPLDAAVPAEPSENAAVRETPGETPAVAATQSTPPLPPDTPTPETTDQPPDLDTRLESLPVPPETPEETAEAVASAEPEVISSAPPITDDRAPSAETAPASVAAAIGPTEEVAKSALLPVSVGAAFPTDIGPTGPLFVRAEIADDHTAPTALPAIDDELVPPVEDDGLAPLDAAVVTTGAPSDAALPPPLPIDKTDESSAHHPPPLPAAPPVEDDAPVEAEAPPPVPPAIASAVALTPAEPREPELTIPDTAPAAAPFAWRTNPAEIAAPAAIAFDRPTEPIAGTSTPRTAPWHAMAQRTVLVIGAIAVTYAALVLVLIVLYRFVDPPRSTVMLGAHLSGQSVDYRPVSIGNISSYLQRAVVTSEDARFCSHRGVDWGALAEAIQDSRGGSTITMQTAKNLFLWPSRSYIRKAIEIPVALTIDFVWPKRRILEVYLNIAEWGPGIFGAEAASRYHFDKPASRLTQQEATLLAASLPNPIAREAGDPGRVTALLAARLRARMANSDAYVGCLGLRPMPRAAPNPAPRPSVNKAAPKAAPWQTKTEPAKPEAPFNPWQN